MAAEPGLAVKVVINTQAVELALREAGSMARTRIGKTVNKLGLELLQVVKAFYLSGVALNVRTGRLRRSINLRYEDNGATISASVGTNVEYGRFWELGFSGTEMVRAHMRKTSKAEGMVKAHERKVNQPARPFLAPALEDMGPRIESALLEGTDLRRTLKGE